jgi:hypothetical protein
MAPLDMHIVGFFGSFQDIKLTLTTFQKSQRHAKMAEKSPFSAFKKCTKSSLERVLESVFAAKRREEGSQR